MPQRPGLDRLGVAYGGLLHLTGEADRPPVRPGVTVADYLTGVFAAEAALAALYRRDAGRAADGKRADGTQGAVVDASLYGSVLRILEWTIPAYDRLGTVRSREGNRLSNSAPLDNYPTADGNYVCVVAGGDANFGRLCGAMGRLDLLEDPRFTTLADRARNGDTINAIVAAWTSTQSAAEVERVCVAHDVPVATAYTRPRHRTRPAFRGAPRPRRRGRPRPRAPAPAGAVSEARGRERARAGRSPGARSPQPRGVVRRRGLVTCRARRVAVQGNRVKNLSVRPTDRSRPKEPVMHGSRSGSR